MPFAVKVRSFLRNLFSSRPVATDLDAEVRSHLAMLTEENLRAGMPPQEAQRRARIELGGIDQVKEQVSEIRLGNWLHSVLSDWRVAHASGGGWVSKLNLRVPHPLRFAAKSGRVAHPQRQSQRQKTDTSTAVVVSSRFALRQAGAIRPSP